MKGSFWEAKLVSSMASLPTVILKSRTNILFIFEFPMRASIFICNWVLKDGSNSGAHV